MTKPTAAACAALLLFGSIDMYRASAQVAVDADRVTVTRDAMIARYGAGSKFIDIDGVNVRYKDEGAGPVILLIHGSFGSLEDWDGWMAPLVPGYRVIRLDLPAFGLTGGVPSGNYSIDRMQSLVDGFMDRLGVERFTIVGISYGGLVAFRYAATRRDRIEGLILINSAGIEYGGRRGTTTPPPPSSNDFVNRPLIDEAYMRRVLGQTINRPARLTPDIIRRKVDMANIVGRDTESRVSVGLYERGTPERVLARVRAPVLVMWGGANKALSTETAYAFTRGMKGACSAKTLVYPGAGHALTIDEPDATARDARAFLEASVRRRPARCR